jgi:hypothetical protein
MKSVILYFPRLAYLACGEKLLAKWVALCLIEKYHDP